VFKQTPSVVACHRRRPHGRMKEIQCFRHCGGSEEVTHICKCALGEGISPLEPSQKYLNFGTDMSKHI
jgi:hypothetical protein